MRKLLNGYRVLDLSQIGAGPTCGMLLADFGAEVIKIEPPAGDIGRSLGPPWYNGESPIHIAFNRGKRSVCLDLKSPEGVAAIRRLVADCDVLIESYRPGVMGRLGLGFDDLQKINPRLVYCAVSGYGQQGPYAHKAGVDGILQAASGLMGLVGHESTEPSKVQAPIVDVFTGYVAALGVFARLFERNLTQNGGIVDVSLFGCAIALQHSAITAFLSDHEQPRKIGSAAPYSAPNEAFRTADGWIMVAAYLGDRWMSLCTILERPDLVHDKRFSTSSDRVINRQALREKLNSVFSRHPSDHWLSLLEERDILCSKVADYADVLANPQLEFLRLIVTTETASGRFSMPGNPINPREMNHEPFAGAPKRGEHTASVLTGSAIAASNGGPS